MTRSKAEWRRALLSSRASIPERARHIASAAIVSRLLEIPCVRDAHTILGYVALGAEVDPGALMAAARQRGTVVMVPSTASPDGRPSWVVEPSSARRSVPIDFPAVVIVPGVGFDEAGTRLGRGAGFYDRALGTLRAGGLTIAIGVAFDIQIERSLPRDEWDQPMDLIASETRLLVTSKDTISIDYGVTSR